MADTNMKQNEKQGRERKAQSPISSTNSQDRSLFFQAPQEIRDKIYIQLFSITTLSSRNRSTITTFPSRKRKRGTVRNARVKIKPASNALAILSTCHRAKKEIGDKWLAYVLFNFDCPKVMLDKLASLPTSTICKIRHMRVTGEALTLDIRDTDAFAYYMLYSALKLLPGLQLDKLTVLRGRQADNYDTLTGLIRYSDGWKELNFMGYDSELNGDREATPCWDAVLRNHFPRHPQPADWQHSIEKRDGVSTNPSVKFYHLGSIGRGRLMGDGELQKELMVVVTRGKGVAYMEKENSPRVDSDIRRYMSGKSWEQIRDEGIERSDEV